MAYTLEQSRKIIRQPDRSDLEIMAACKVLRLKGNWRDQEWAERLEEVIAAENNIMEII